MCGLKEVTGQVITCVEGRDHKLVGKPLHIHNV